MTKKIACLASTALVGCLLSATAAMAQSTGTEAVEQVVVTASSVKNQNGAIVQQVVPKSRSTITQEFIARQVPGQTILDSLNLMPGVNFTNNDAYGSAGGDITIRGVDSQRIALLQDGVPLNDSGNYAIYPNQQMDSELISKVEVNTGTTDVDSPTAAAAGGTINYTTRKPTDEFGGVFEAQAGDGNFRRFFGVIDTGKVGPFGTSAWFSYADAINDVFNGPGKIHKKQINARIYQPIGDNGDFVSLIANYNENRNNFINRMTLAQFNAGTGIGYSRATCARPTPVAGTAQIDVNAGSCYKYNINPSNTGNIRGQSLFHIGDNFILTVDPSFQYVLANGGGRALFKEDGTGSGNGIIRGSALTGGKDLNGDGDTIDSVLLYSPNTTNTRRYGVTSSLIWKFSDSQSFRAAYTYDEAHHRQTGEYTTFSADTTPNDVFGGKDGYGQSIKLSDGSILRKRDRVSVATLNQISVEYRGKFMDDKVLLNAGVRAPFFKRELHNFCYQADTFTAYCTNQTPTAVAGSNDGNGQTLVTLPGQGATQYGRPREFTRKYDKLLPSVAASYVLADYQSVYVSYAKTLSAPRTDDLYDKKLTDPGPELTDSYDIGYRYQSPTILLSAAVWYTDFSNRIERAFNEQDNIAFSINVGDVKKKGFDAAFGFKPEEYLSFYASYSYQDSELQENIPGTTLGSVLPTKGKELYEAPKHQGAVRVDWDITEAFSVGVQAKYVGERWTNLTNTEKAPSYALLDLDARYMLTNYLEGLGMKNTYVQINVKNLSNEKYLGDLAVNPSGTGLGQPGYPRTASITLHAAF
ncbi:MULTISPECIES: TonB-dependent receptor [unclassified Caulobacter]|uniref:TonB-dependent receptor n=1 Tax=unclassified Caulobacter TaxID=2648921 RepID=UPI0012E3BA74|nr:MULTISPECIES: TonB-dependent receptor [unclassified Caulobacter]